MDKIKTRPNGKVKLLFCYDADQFNRIVYHVGVDEAGKYYIVEEHEYNIGSAYSVYRDYYLINDQAVEPLRQKAAAREAAREKIRQINEEQKTECETKEETVKAQDTDPRYYRKKAEDKICWLKDTSDGQFFTFDMVKLYDLKADYPGNLTAEEKEIFDSENAFLAASYRKKPWDPCESKAADVIHHMQYGRITTDNDQMIYEQKGQRYILRFQPSEPCLYLVRGGDCVCMLHNTIKTGTGITDRSTGKEYGEKAFCEILAFAIDSGRDEMDLQYAAEKGAQL